MSSTSVTTLIKMVESLPEATQSQVVEHVRAFIAEMRDEQQWESAFDRTQEKLVAAARLAKQEIATGKAEPMDLNRL